MSAPLILIVEDEQKIAQLVSDYCAHAGYDTHCIYHGDDALPWIKHHDPAAIILDIMLPGTDGLTICHEVRTFSDVPILMVTAKVEEVDRLLGLDIGADDYICKPFSPKEVVARINSIFRRMNKSLVHQDAIRISETTLEAIVYGCRIDLTLVEMRILKLLIASPEKIFSREQIMANIYDDHRIVSDRTIDSHVKKLRHKLAPHQEFDVIHSVYGVGYRFSMVKPASC